MKRIVVWLCAAASCARSEWVVAAFVGAAHTRTGNLHIQQPALGTDLVFRDVPFEGRSFESPLYYGYRAGYFFTRHFGVEGEFVHAKAFAEVNRTVTASGTLRGAPVNGRVAMDSIVQAFSISHGLNLILVNGVFRQPVLHGRLTLTARAGAGPTVPHAESNIEGASDQHYELGSAVFQLAPGAELRVWRGLHFTGEYKFTRADERVRIVNGHASVPLASHHLVAGFAWHF